MPMKVGNRANIADVRALTRAMCCFARNLNTQHYLQYLHTSLRCG